VSPLCPYSADYEDLTSEASVRETIFTDLLADSVAVDDEAAADEAPVDGGEVRCPRFVLKPMLMRFENQPTNYCSERIGLRIEGLCK